MGGASRSGGEGSPAEKVTTQEERGGREAAEGGIEKGIGSFDRLG